ncbi:hydantoinase B/oxoprolinase family protein [Stieleria sp. ICT_E10.1]|uniref:hydantoinase B/oxoprolinase family protein n=1 Tax=Stieleria sedimenti TaxID=2976331 RepID=UPI00217F5188|nr:hydantoinase B/oxoprolinase family protein [Stieleria sedimenti]MCS7469926.1 hydantoinase B/oxoprolinase family protein [Stieleria sedimenti]
MSLHTLSVCADVGGTFTDCLAVWTDHSGASHSGCIKVLSTGLIRCRVTDVPDEMTVRIQIPDELLGGLAAGRLPDDFFRSAKLEWLAEGIHHRVGDIRGYDSATSRVALANVDGEIASRLSPGAIVEIDCRREAPVLATHLLTGVPIDDPMPPMTARIGTTRGTNALLTRSGAAAGLVVTEGFGDVLRIGEQDRPELFDLAFVKAPPLAESTLEIRARMDADGEERIAIDEDAIAAGLQALFDAGIETLSICLMHAHRNPAHEIAVEQIARRVGFAEVSRSSEVAPLIKLVARAETTTLDAYLNPILSAYVARVRRQFGGSTCQLQLMTSGGNLVGHDEFRGRDSVLSGPAGGVVGLRHVAQTHRCPLAIGLDMGGTSTDVSRFDGQVGRRYETRIADLRVMTPMMDIHTVAAGGGSICDFQGGRLVVGPSSAGAAPGPACYGSGGPLTVTDANVLLGRLRVDRFPFPLLPAAARERIEHVASRMPAPPEAIESLAEGFLDIAVTHMAEAVRAITTARGVDVRDHALVGFGGAAAQLICRVADALGIRRIVDHPRASVLSAVGMGVATSGRIETVGIYRRLDQVSAADFQAAADDLIAQTVESLRHDQPKSVQTRLECDCRYVGTDASIPLTIEDSPERILQPLSDRFHHEHQHRFGYRRDGHPIELVSLRCEATGGLSPHAEQWLAGDPSKPDRQDADEQDAGGSPRRDDPETTAVFHRGRWCQFKLLDRDQLCRGQTIAPGSIVVSDQSTLIVEPNWEGVVCDDGSITLALCEASVSEEDPQSEAGRSAGEAVQMEIVARRLQSIADAMGEVLRRTAVSVNVKERLDFSCAVFRGDGTLIANAPHVPVHLGAMGHTVRALAGLFPQMSAGDCYVSNDPYAGGSHLPDVTVVTPVFCSDSGSDSGSDSDQAASDAKPSFFVASRAHHAEIGGKTPGSMPPMANSLAEEGVLIRGFALVRNGVSHEDELGKLLSGGPYPSRNVAENLADLHAQIAAGQEGARALQQMSKELSLRHIETMMDRLLDVASDSVVRWIRSLPKSEMRFNDTLDDGTAIAVRLQRDGDRLVVDFDGTSGVHPNGYNATPSIVCSAVLYVMRCFCDSNLPLCDGVLRPIDLRLPTGLLSPPRDDDPARCAAVVAGNVETSQRVVDVLLGAIGSTMDSGPVFRSVAASQGTMNNVLIGDASFGYYETIGGGSGATVFGPGADGVHTHMTNTRITDPEVLESRLPIRLVEFSIRRGSGGVGKHRGGDGLVREFEFLRPLTVSLITSRRTTAPYGVSGGGGGLSGRNRLIRTGRPPIDLPAATTIEVGAGDRLRIETPGGGGWGTPVA